MARVLDATNVRKTSDVGTAGKNRLNDLDWDELREVFSSYESAYNTLFVERKDPAPFIKFMREAVRAYWILGAKMSAINHSVAVWDTLTGQNFKRRVKYEQLFELLDLQRDIFDNS